MRYLVALLAFFMVGCAHTKAKASPKNFQASVISEVKDVKDLQDQSKPLHLYLVGEIDEKTVDLVIAGLKLSESQKRPVILEINSPGGDLLEANRLIRKIERLEHDKLACFVDGIAASAASYVLSSCPVRVMTSKSLLMYHRPAVYSKLNGDKHILISLENEIEARWKAMMLFISMSSKIKYEDLLKNTDSLEFWVTADKALDYGLVDLIAPPRYSK